MAHQIENNEISYKNETPWHGLGYKVADNATGAEMLKIAGLDWPVQKRTVGMKNTNGSGSVIINDFKAIVRGDTQDVFQMSSPRYEIVQNIEIVNFFREFAEAGHASVDVVGALGGGRKIWALAKLNKAEKVIGDGDVLKPYLLFMTAHDGTFPTVGKAVNERVVCANTLAVALGEKGRELRIRHNRKWTPELRAYAQTTLGVAVEAVERINTIAEKFSKVHLDGKGKVEFLTKLLNLDKKQTVVSAEPTQEEIDAVVASYLSDVDSSITEAQVEGLGRVGGAILEAIYDSPGSHLATAEGTLWGALNGVTYYVDHVRGRSQDNRLDAAWFGTGATLKEKAIQVGAELAGITV